MASDAGSLDSVHILYDEPSGFSATMKMFDHNPATSLASRDFANKAGWTTRAPMLALTRPDPVLAFPAKVMLRPMVLVRNTTSRATAVQAELHWRSSNKDGRVNLPALMLAPYEVRKIDIGDLQRKWTVPEDAMWAQISLSANTEPDGIMAVAASYDSTLRYGAQTPFSDQMASQLEGGEWKVDANHTSLIAAGNGGSQPIQAALTLMYDQGRKHYQLQQTIAADDQWWIDLAQLIRNQVPDKDGNTLPADLSSGAYSLREIGNTAPNFLYEGKVITDKTFGHATYGCMICCGVTDGDVGLPFFELDPTIADVGGTVPVDLYGTNACTGTAQLIEDFPTTWSTDDSTIMTAAGLSATGIAIGATTIRAHLTGVPTGDGEDSRSCPTGFVNMSGGGMTAPTVTFGSLTAVAVGGSASVAVSFSNGATTSPSTITLTLTTASGTGSAAFANGATTMTITAPTTVTINGLTVSSTANNLLLNASASGSEGAGTQEDATNPQSFTAVSVSLTLQTSGPEAVPNGYLAVSALGVQVSNTYVAGNTACLAAYQVTGQITPSNYQGSIYLRRTVTSRGYTDPGATLNMSQTNQDDTSNPILEATKNGMIYDLDGPADLISGSFPVGNSSRLRTNFDEYAVLGTNTSTTKVPMSDLLFYTRVSCQKASSISVILDTTYPGDNQIGLGTTNLSDNLQ